MRSPEEWDRLESSYCCGTSIPRLVTVQDFVEAVVSGAEDKINCALIRARRYPSILLPLFQELAIRPTPALKCRIAFHGAWVTQGLHLRDFFAIDPVLPAALANMMPGYAGPDVELFRGERWSNYQSGTYGPAWSSERSVAEMFARGLNCEPGGGGVLLRTFAPAAAILAGSEYGHMRDESEYVVDRRALNGVEVIERYESE